MFKQENVLAFISGIFVGVIIITFASVWIAGHNEIDNWYEGQVSRDCIKKNGIPVAISKKVIICFDKDAIIDLRGTL